VCTDDRAGVVNVVFACCVASPDFPSPAALSPLSPSAYSASLMTAMIHHFVQKV